MGGGGAWERGYLCLTSASLQCYEKEREWGGGLGKGAICAWIVLVSSVMREGVHGKVIISEATCILLHRCVLVEWFLNKY